MIGLKPSDIQYDNIAIFFLNILVDPKYIDVYSGKFTLVSVNSLVVMV